MHSWNITLPQENYNTYVFPANSYINLNDKKISVSGISINLSGVLNSIGYKANAQCLLPRTMAIIGNNQRVINLPFCIYGYPNLPEPPLNKIYIWTIENKEIDFENAIDRISEIAKNTYSYINIPLDVHKHVSLGSLKLENGKARLQFYDSLPDEIINYSKRYTEKLVDFIKSLFAKQFEIEEGYDVLHLLQQGDEESNGCGYYTLYTAALIKENKGPFEERLKPADDQKIRAELVLTSMLGSGLETVDDKKGFIYGDQLYHNMLSQVEALKVRDQLIERGYSN